METIVFPFTFIHTPINSSKRKRKKEKENLNFK
jgi:hypothetical protein